MNRYSFIKGLFLLLLFTTSCKVQEPTDQAKETEQTNQAKEKQAEPMTSFIVEDHWGKDDPYFVDTKTIESEQGPKSITRNMIQDKKGNIWLATWEGIMRYDGNTFTNFTNKDTLRRFHVFAVMEDSKANIWFGSIGGGVFLYNGESFVNFTTKDGLASDRVGCIYEDKDGMIWIGTEQGISCYNGKGFRNFTKEDGLFDNDINSIIEDESGKIWIGARGEACTYDGSKFELIKRADGRSFGNVRCIIKDQKGNIWLGGSPGLWCYDGSTFTQLSNTFVGYIHEDQKGHIWTSTEAVANWRLIRYEGENFPAESPIITTFEPEAGMLFGILEDADENIWVGSLKGVGRYDGESFDFFE